MTALNAAEPPVIAAVFATMNRKDAARQCVMSLAAQTLPLDFVVVADNVSSDGTVAALRNLKQLPFKLVIHEMASNAGNAGGIEKAMELAYAAGAEAVWLLDDDSWPRPEALKEMLHHYDPEVVRHPLQIDPATSRFTWPVIVNLPQKGKALIWNDSLFQGARFLPSYAGWTGAIISRLIYQSVGPVKGELFIRGEDEEYPWRISRAGYRFELACKAVLDHPGPRRLVHWQLFGKNFLLEPDLAEWKLFYKVRNMVWLKRQESGSMKAALMAVTYMAAVVKIDGSRHIPILLQAIYRGWRGCLGKSSFTP